ncbi:MAG: winged helix-turn-helix domain-containing protein [Caldilineaceae bacterium]|nr:winged helix-turn-helix domain-containing protein [Caldilineaceae bacterium]
MTRKVSINWALKDTADALHAQYRAEPVAEVRTRLQALWRLHLGEGPTAVAAGVGVSRGGHGTPSYLTPAQQEQVVAEAAKGVFATAQAVRDWIEERFGVVYTRDSLYTLLPRLGIRLKVPRPRHAQTDPQAQAAWPKGGSRSAWPRSA